MPGRGLLGLGTRVGELRGVGARRLPAVLWWLARTGPAPEGEFTVPSAEAPRLLAAAETDLEREFFGNTGRPVDKWIHYLAAYQQHFGAYRGTPVRMLEIGVFRGGSLDLWRRYFGPEATIVGIDIDPGCAERVTAPNHVRIGSQDDPAFLASVVAEFGPFDIVLDDGSHVGKHQRTSFEQLFPAVRPGGVYAIEDLHTSYWPRGYDGGWRRRGTGIDLVKSLIDDMHGWYYRRDTRSPAREWISGIHVYDSLVVIDKQQRGMPQRILVNGPAEDGEAS